VEQSQAGPREYPKTQDIHEAMDRWVSEARAGRRGGYGPGEIEEIASDPMAHADMLEAFGYEEAPYVVDLDAPEHREALEILQGMLLGGYVREYWRAVERGEDTLDGVALWACQENLLDTVREQLEAGKISEAEHEIVRTVIL
jgi:hypothetical protein